MKIFLYFIKLILLFFYGNLSAQETNLNFTNEETELIIKSNNIKVFVDDVKSYDGKSIFGKIDLFKKIKINEKFDQKSILGHVPFKK